VTNARSAAPEIVFVVAVAENGVIGRNNEIPWRLKADMQRFRALTLGKPIVMGRKTFLSLKRPLPGRTNIVMTRDANFCAAGAVVVATFTAALEVARGDALRRSVAEIAVIGGADVYARRSARDYGGACTAGRRHAFCGTGSCNVARSGARAARRRGRRQRRLFLRDLAPAARLNDFEPHVSLIDIKSVDLTWPCSCGARCKVKRPRL